MHAISARDIQTATVSDTTASGLDDEIAKAIERKRGQQAQQNPDRAVLVHDIKYACAMAGDDGYIVFSALIVFSV